MGRYWIALAVTGCVDIAGIGEPAPITPEPSCTIGGLDLCLYGRPTNDIVLAEDIELRTATDCTLQIFALGEPRLCVHYARNIDVSAAVSASGNLPLVLVATERITIRGTVDVSSYLLEDGNELIVGAAADSPDCERTFAAGPGAGGSFQGKGGDGGASPSLSESQRGKAAPAVPLPDRIRGGCRGDDDNPSGGAVWLAAGIAISVEIGGRVLANGAGGRSKYLTSIPGGGGSGGFIRVRAPTITIAGTLAANGGGGGEGGIDNTLGRNGSNGLASDQAAPGGTGGSPNGGDGGNGGAGAALDGSPGANAVVMDYFGGGGGGGVGFIEVRGDDVTTLGATISPPPHL